AAQPVLLTTGEDNPNNASVRFLVDGAAWPAEAAAYERIVLLFDGDDPDAVAAARERWTSAKAQGLAATYWQTDEDGRWQRKAGFCWRLMFSKPRSPFSGIMLVPSKHSYLPTPPAPATTPSAANPKFAHTGRQSRCELRVQKRH